jgi:hypothetical protein
MLSLEREFGERLAMMAERTYIPEGTALLLSQAIDEADPDARGIVETLDATPGAFERAERGIDEVLGGRGIPLDQI